MFFLADNHLDGSIPVELVLLSNLEFQLLSINMFAGMIPSRLYNLSSIYDLAIANNQFSDRLPLDIGLKLPNLHSLLVGDNNFSGSIPKSLVTASSLQELDLVYYNLTGAGTEKSRNLARSSIHRFPSSFGNISGFLSVQLSENFLEGTIPVSLANCNNLEFLNLTLNHLSGDIPKQIMNISSLTFGLLLGSNKLTSYQDPCHHNWVT